jgi:signal transduction histidine kinase
MNQDTSFPRLVSLACHDLRTPLATVHGFARTLSRRTELAPPADRYMEMIEAAAGQLAELLDELSLAARIESGRYDPNLRETDTLELARSAAAQLGEDRVRVDGTGAPVHVDLEATERGIAALVQAALRHGGLEQVDVHVDGLQLRVGPITASSGAVVLGTDLRDLGAAVAVRLIERLGGELSLDGDELRVRLPG